MIDGVGGGSAGLFRPRLWVPLLAVPAMVVVAILILHLVLSAIFSKPLPWGSMVETAAISGVAAAIGTALGQRRILGGRLWVRVSPAGIELAPYGRAVLLAWDAVDAVRVRRYGPAVLLEVTPKNLHTIGTDVPRRDLPRLRYRHGLPVLTKDVSYLFPGPGRLRAELARYAPPTRS